MNFTVAIIGCGRIANNAHLPALEKLPNVRIKYACDLILEKANKAKEKFPKIEQTIEDYNIALSDPEIDAVFVLTPNYSHYTVTMDALRAGKHVMCEKPITISYELSQEMANLANEKGLMLNIGVCNRHNAAVEKLAQMNANGELGKIYHVVCSFRKCRSIPGLGGAFTDKSKSGGGVLIDWGVHFLDLVLYILGYPKIQSASSAAYCETAKDMKSYKYEHMWAEDTKDTENGVNDVDDFVSGFVRTEKATISLNGAWAQNVKRDEMYIDFMGDKKGARLDYGKLFDLFDSETMQESKPEITIPNHFLCEDEAFFNAIESGVKDKNHIDFVIETQRLLDALYRSSELGAEVKL